MKHEVNIYKEDRLVLKDVLPLKYPLCISIEPTNLCNFKCIMCDHGTNENNELAKPLCNMSKEIFSKTLADLKSWVDESNEGQRIKLIKLYSIGEPLLNSNICDMLKCIKEADVCEKVEITTNASLLNERVAEKFVEYGLDICRVSIYANDQNENNRITQVDVDIESIRRNVEYLFKTRGNKSKPFIVAKMIDSGEKQNALFEERYKNISDLVSIDELMQNGLDDHSTHTLYYGDESEIELAYISNKMKRQRKICRYPFTHLTIRNDGSVVACCSDWLKELCIGNVLDSSLKDIWNSKKLYDLRKDMITFKGSNHRICQNCDIPYRDCPEDNIDDISIDRFSFFDKQNSSK